MSDQPFSVVIPLFNKRDQVERCVRSVLEQRHASFELIVVDDGSTDGSAAVLAGIDDPRLRIVRQENQGVAAARNRGIAEARHAWVALLDADDFWRPDHLGELARMIAQRPDAGIVASGVTQLRDGRVTSDEPRAEPTIREIDYFAAGARDVLIVNCSVVALRRTAVQSIGGFRDLRPGEDIDCWCRLALDWPVMSSTRRTGVYDRGAGAMAGWANQKRMRRDIAALTDFGGAVATLAKALDTGRYEARRASIERYIDARILSGVGKCLSLGDSVNARNRLRFVHDRTGRTFRLYSRLARLPGPVVKKAVRAGSAVRAALRRVRGAGTRPRHASGAAAS